ncbi:hypothetical protein BC835DRAFT_1085889 [Cytidiella melzeri]|nr:hypothetical protein BC835DRAFT_1085889 [Cytidiella melzeri]
MRKTWSKRSTTQAHFNSASSRLYTSVGTQTGLPIPLHATATSAATQTGPPILPQETKAASLEEDSVSSGREKSLSPMELDSAPSSPSPPSPPPLPEAELPLPVVAKSSSFSPPGLWVSASPQPQPVVIQTNNFSSNMSAKGDDPRGPSLTLPPERLRPISPLQRQQLLPHRQRSAAQAQVLHQMRYPGSRSCQQTYLLLCFLWQLIEM